MRLQDFDYKLPEGLIAKYGLKERQKSRLMVLDRKTSKIEDRLFEDIVDYIDKDDLLVLNDTKVIPARLFGKRKTGGRIEIFLLQKPKENNLACEALIRPAKRLKEGEKLILESGDEAEILKKGCIGRFVKFSRSPGSIMEKYGHIPLPPYIKRGDEPIDKDAYQTVYAKKTGATASPTAGLHFTEKLLKEIENKGAKTAYVTLHTSYGTFAPIKTDDVEQHKMHKEYFNMPKETARLMRRTKKAKKRVFSVGTTTTRVLEYCSNDGSAGYTDLFIYPPYRFKAVDCLITNFHLPKSTLLLLVCAFAGKDLIFRAYQHAIEKKYRFYSYGDAMLVL